MLKVCAYDVRKAPIRDLLISIHKTRDFEWQTAHTKGCQENRCELSETADFVYNFVQKPYASEQLRWPIWPTFPSNFFIQFSQKMLLYLFYTIGAKKSKMTKNSNQGGPALRSTLTYILCVRCARWEKERERERERDTERERERERRKSWREMPVISRQISLRHDRTSFDKKSKKKNNGAGQHTVFFTWTWRASFAKLTNDHVSWCLFV